MKQIYRFTYATQCGKTNVVIETGSTMENARMAARLNIECKHTPMVLKKVEVRRHGECNWVLCA